jgi:hypothetical protein
MLGRVKDLLVLLGDHVLARRGFENFQLLSFALLFAFFLELAQFGRVFLPAAMQACLRELQIADLFFVGEKGLIAGRSEGS